jgi:hypothetical protein
MVGTAPIMQPGKTTSDTLGIVAAAGTSAPAKREHRGSTPSVEPTWSVLTLSGSAPLPQQLQAGVTGSTRRCAG